MHGGIDGYSRKIVYMHVSGNNSADTVTKHFMKINGWPSKSTFRHGM